MNLAISNKSLSGVPTFLQSAFNLITHPYLNTVNGECVKNFDTYLFYDTIPSVYAEMSQVFDLRGVPYIGGPRLTKSNQHQLMHHLGVNCPWFASRDILIADDPRQDGILEMVKSHSDDTLFIVKSNNGARGLGQALLKINDFTKFFMDSADRNVDYDKYVDKWGSKLGGSESDRSEGITFLRDNIRSNDFFVTKYEPNIVGEFRIVKTRYDLNKPIVIRRSKLDKWQANSAITHFGETIEYSDITSLGDGFNKVNLKALLTDMDSIINAYAYPWLAFDVYVTEEGEYGFFEFQMQFGYDLLPKQKLVKHIINSVIKMIGHNEG